MKYASWIFGAIFLIFAASCNVLNPTANQVQIDASVLYGGTCPVGVNLDGNNGVTIGDGGQEQFPLVSPGSHVLNFSTSNPATVCSGSNTNCFYGNNNQASYSVTFNTTAGVLYVASVTQSGSACNGLSVIGPN
jgi:hypothetical protein